MKLRLKELRKERGLTQRQVAEAAGMSVSYYTELEGGKKPINANRMDALARVFDVEPQELIFDSSVPNDAELLRELEALSDADKKTLRKMIAAMKSDEDPATP